MECNVDYKFRDDLFNSETATIRDTVPMELLLGVYKGVVFRYNEVAISEESDGTATLKFSYDILDPGTFMIPTLEEDPLFTEVLGTILNTLILETVDADRENNPEELDPERGVFEEDSPLSEG